MGEEAAAAAGERQWYWDVVRGSLMLLGVPLHAALIYMPSLTWVVTSPERSALAGYAYQFIHAFRMPVFFVIAGYFTALALERRRPGAWARSRLIRLGTPLLFGALFINPLQVVVARVGRQELGPYDLHLAWAESLHDLAVPGRLWVRHLWFLIVLLYFTVGAAMIAWAVPAAATVRRDRLPTGRVPFIPLLIALACLIGLYEVAMRVVIVHLGWDAGLAGELFNLADLLEFLPYFALGAVLQRSHGLLHLFTRPSPSAWLALVLAYATWAAWHGSRIVAKPVISVLMAQLLLSVARTHLNRPIPAVRQLAQASFVIYLVHMPIVEALGVLMLHVRLMPAVEWVLVSVAALPLSFGVWRLVIAYRWSNLAFNGVVPPAGPRATPRRVAPAD